MCCSGTTASSSQCRIPLKFKGCSGSTFVTPMARIYARDIGKFPTTMSFIHLFSVVRRLSSSTSDEVAELLYVCSAAPHW